MKRDLISLDSIDEAYEYISLAEKLESVEKSAFCKNKIMMSMFFEPSTRTKLSFESAMYRLGGRVLGFSDVHTTSGVKGESLYDTVKVVENYADVLVIRHPKEGSARLAAEISKVPVINAGDGSNQHPTQTLLDLYTIKKYFDDFDYLKIALVGDLKYSRTVHSLVQMLNQIPSIKIGLVSPESLKLPSYIPNNGKEIDLEEAIRYYDVIYMTRIQKERFPDLIDYERVKDSYCITAKMLEQARPELKIMHPLPRVNEIALDVDNTKHSAYFEQAKNGIVIRQAILCKLLCENFIL